MTRPREDTYLLDPENIAEMARLEQQGYLLTKGLGGTMPELGNQLPRGTKKVLDLGCGPGEWVREIATAFPHTEVTGLDISEIMVAYAQAVAQEKNLSNAHFVRGNLLENLHFPNHCFDLVNARALGVVLKGECWEPAMHEWLRITRPDGMIRLTELEDDAQSNKPAYDKMNDWFVRASRKLGYGFELRPDTLNLLPTLAILLKKVGWQDVQEHRVILNLSYGTPYHTHAVRNYRVAFRQLWPVFQILGLSLEEIEETYNAMLLAVAAPDFRATHPVITLSAKKPTKQTT
jgi:SAM-dependent methyltransferase